jgi:hypothetical protein
MIMLVKELHRTRKVRNLTAGGVQIDETLVRQWKVHNVTSMVAERDFVAIMNHESEAFDYPHIVCMRLIAVRM